MTDQQLKIKVGVLKRAVKEHKMYKEEVAKTSADLEALGPEHDRFRQLSQTLEESKAMLLDAANRVAEARETMQVFLETESVDKESELAAEAAKLIDESKDLA